MKISLGAYPSYIETFSMVFVYLAYTFTALGSTVKVVM